MKYRVISLFSGCGGLDLGFKNAGYKTVFATDIWDIACKTLLMNKAADEVVCGDIRNMDFKKLTKMQMAALFIIFIMVISGVAGFLLMLFQSGA